MEQTDFFIFLKCLGGRVENPKKVFNIGDKVTVLIKDIQGEKIALSLKFPEENPWLKAEEKYKVGSVVTGKVARMTDFGAFVELESGIDALLHVSQIAKEHIDKPSDVLSVGQEIEAKVVDFKKDDKKISLSMKALANEEEKNRRIRFLSRNPDFYKSGFFFHTSIVKKDVLRYNHS